MGHDVHGFGLLLERLDDAFEKTLPVFEERPYHVVAGRTHGHAVRRLIVRTE